MLELRRNRDRGYADHGWLKTYYAFSFGDYYDPEHVDFGPLTVLNGDRIKPGKGYPDEQVQDTEVLIYSHRRRAPSPGLPRKRCQVVRRHAPVEAQRAELELGKDRRPPSGSQEVNATARSGRAATLRTTTSGS
jgi:hypothetical protein